MARERFTFPCWYSPYAKYSRMSSSFTDGSSSACTAPPPSLRSRAEGQSRATFIRSMASRIQRTVW